MNDPVSQPPSVVAILVIALLMLFWQYMRARRRADLQPRFPGIRFWFGITMWVILGLQLRAGVLPALPDFLRWLIPFAGLLMAAILRLATVELSRAAIERAGAEVPREEEKPPAAAQLDLEDVRLLRRLEALLGRRAIGLMVPASSVETVTEKTRIEEVIKLLRENGAIRVPVLDYRRQQPLGVIDTRDLLPMLYDEATVEEVLAQTAQEYCHPIPAVQADQSAQAALDVLRDGDGIAAVTNTSGRAIGFLAWPPLLRALIGQPLKGGRL